MLRRDSIVLELEIIELSVGLSKISVSLKQSQSDIEKIFTNNQYVSNLQFDEIIEVIFKLLKRLGI